ncbi:hypothetical protein FACS189426_06450 [Bacteroidia bacterium]|nr:hypothetical protein FACS189426_06450 [Bacteroidia bacterium]
MRHIEDNLQISCIRWFDYQYPKIKMLLHHSPNGGKRQIREAARFKQMGVRAGFPDVILLIGNGQFNALCIEFKTEKGRQTELQKEWQKEAEKNGNKYVICRSIDNFIHEIKNYLK